MTKTREPKKAACAFCGGTSPKVPPTLNSHPDCANAWGLDYNPTSASDARSWLRRRRALFAALIGACDA